MKELIDKERRAAKCYMEAARMLDVTSATLGHGSPEAADALQELRHMSAQWETARWLLAKARKAIGRKGEK